MKFFETSKYYSLNKPTYINLRWIGIIGQLITIYLVYFIFSFQFNFILANLIIFIGILSNLYLMYINKNILNSLKLIDQLLQSILVKYKLIFLVNNI